MVVVVAYIENVHAHVGAMVDHISDDNLLLRGVCGCVCGVMVVRVALRYQSNWDLLHCHCR